MKAAVYLRQSLDVTGEGLAVNRQREDCLRLCAEKGWTPVEYVDNDTSASKGIRPSYQKMLAAIKTGAVQAVVAWDLDRLHRQPRELEDFIDLADEYRLKLATVSGDVDLGNDQGRLIARIKGVVARQEVERKSARQKRAAQQRAEAGKPMWPGTRVFGYTDEHELDPFEAQLVAQAYRDFIAGTSLNSIRKDWNARGIKTVRGNEWAHGRLASLLKACRNAGLREYRGEIIGKGAWPAIVSEDVYRAAIALFNGNARNAPSVARKHLLSGLAICDVCKGSLGVKKHAPKDRKSSHWQYTCPARRCVSRAKEPVDVFVIEAVYARLARPDAVELVNDKQAPNLDHLRDVAESCRLQLNEAAADRADGIITRAQYLVQTERLRVRLREAERDMADASRVYVFAGIPLGTDEARAAFDDLDIDRKRLLINTIMRITVLRTVRGRKGFDSTSVRIEWKEEESE